MPRLAVINLKDLKIKVVPVGEVADIAEELIREIAQGAKPRVEGLYDILEAADRNIDHE